MQITVFTEYITTAYQREMDDGRIWWTYNTDECSNGMDVRTGDEWFAEWIDI